VLDVATAAGSLPAALGLSGAAVLAPVSGALCLLAVVALGVRWWRRVRRSRRRRALR